MIMSKSCAVQMKFKVDAHFTCVIKRYIRRFYVQIRPFVANDINNSLDHLTGKLHIIDYILTVFTLLFTQLYLKITAQFTI